MKKKRIFIHFLVILLLSCFGFYPMAQVGDSMTVLDKTQVLDDTSETQLVQIDTSNISRKFDENFNAKYQGKDYEYKIKVKEPKQSDSASLNLLLTLVKYLIYILIGLALGYAIFVLITILIGKRGAWSIFKKSDELGVFYENQETAILQTNYGSLIEDAILSNDFRLAVRYQYLHTLQKLSSKGFIDLHQDKTNSDYKYEISNQTLRQSFSYISYIYDHTWYGAFEMTDHDYTMAKRAFDDTSKLMGYG